MAGPYVQKKECEVDFRSGGDTTKVAFEKHIKDINHIYGYLNDLNSDKVDAQKVDDAITAHRNDANPHPNWTLPVPTLGSLTGTLSGSKVTGELTNATIDKMRVNGLTTEINNRAEAIVNSKVDSLITSGDGYLKFGNGLMLQWGTITTTDLEELKEYKKDFPQVYGTQAYTVLLSQQVDGILNVQDYVFQLILYSRSGFSYVVQRIGGSSPGELNGTCHWLSIGK